MSRIRPWVKKALLVSVIIVAVGAGLKMMDGQDGREMTKVVRISEEFHGRPAGNMKVEIRGGEDAAVPSLRGGDAAVRVPAQVPILGEGRIHIERGHDGVGPGVAMAGIVLLAVLLVFWMRKRSKRPSMAGGAKVLANIPTASDFLDQWEMQQNQTKELK
ncbi:hypothetical protein [Paenibacillus sp. MMS18-CY102]|uniref:hypothetical protein n=1 Tax=Paenibacillus sp. MMS18-CY102 TaxID=2682849 RepID=UPI0013652320|nr:hypothetical protein [Paenibacillus sp. MMS18-CY102]MWC29790.1 hypothetical protein [Paenibacillus sp. MMS18-CY102]